MKEKLPLILYLKRVIAIFSISLCLVCPGYAAERDVTLLWDESIDAPYLQSYNIYYSTAPCDSGSLNTADYAVSYTLAGGSPVFLNPLTDPKPITIDKNNTQITIHFSDASKIYFFAATAVDTVGLESIPTPEVTFSFVSSSFCSGGAVVLQNQTFISGNTYNCIATTSITAGAGVTVQSGATVYFRAPMINLQSGFRMESGAVFSAKQCPNYSNF
jgi:hypothetical protein